MILWRLKIKNPVIQKLLVLFPTDDPNAVMPKGEKFFGASSKVVGKICPHGWNRVD